MTEAAIAADGGAVDNDIGGAPLDDAAASVNNPLGSQTPTDDRDNGKAEPKSLDDSIDRAFAKAEAKASEKAAAEKTAKDQPVKEPVKEPQQRENGRFVAAKPVSDGQPANQQQPKPALPSHTAEEPPARFAETAKSKWASADPELRGEVLRMERELTQGFQKHREKAERYDQYAELDDIARNAGHRSGADVFKQYYDMEQHLLRDPISGLDTLCQKLGFSLRDVAAHVLNQTPDQQASQSDATIRELKAQIAQLTQQVGGVVQNHQQQTISSINKEVLEFMNDPAHSRFEELKDDIAFFLQTRCHGDLKEAYRLAERLNPVDGSQTNSAAANAAPAASSAAASADDDEAAQTRKGSRSTHGAPSAGSAPGAKKRPPKSLDDALEAAFAGAG